MLPSYSNGNFDLETSYELVILCSALIYQFRYSQTILKVQIIGHFIAGSVM